MSHAGAPRSGANAAALWKAVATLPRERARALTGLESCFCAGTAPRGLNGRLHGRFVTTTFGPGVDQFVAVLARLWMPWKGKVFDAAAESGRNWFTDSARLPIRLLFPGYAGIVDDRPGGFTAFRFRTELGTSRLFGHLTVLRIDYDDPDNPAWPVRRILDEVVRLEDDLYLGQALLRRRGGWTRAAWFALEH